MTCVIGLTGSLAMGKSTVARLCRRLGAHVFDADREVHRLLAHNTTVQAALISHFPEISVEGKINRRALGERVFQEEGALRILEALLHPLVRVAEERAIIQARRHGLPYIVLDIPLLYETGADIFCDKVMVVTAPEFIQLQRIKARGISTSHRQAILSRQLPDREKRLRADAIIHTGIGKGHTCRQLKTFLSQVLD